jgi:hypothetical protein
LFCCLNICNAMAVTSECKFIVLMVIQSYSDEET